MLSDLNKVKWPEIRNASGTSEHIPEAIKLLASSQEKEREEGYWQLDNYVVLQGDLFPAAFYIIPFLIEILQTDRGCSNTQVYNLLFEIANGCSSSTTLYEVNGKDMPLDAACRTRLADSSGLFIQHLKDENSSYKDGALDLLFSLNDIIDNLSAELMQVLHKETDTDIKKNIEEVLQEISLDS